MDEKIEYIAEYVNEELERFHYYDLSDLMSISSKTIWDAIDAWEGGAGEK